MTGPGRIIIDGRPIPFGADDSVAVAMMRAGLHPNHGGTLCLAGDCGNCVVEVDGVAYVRSCQIRARPELVVQRHPAADAPPMPTANGADPG